MVGARTSLIVAISVGMAAPVGVAMTRAGVQPTSAISATASEMTVCVVKKTGAMRQPKGKKPCGKSERTMVLNTTGPVGPAGAPGPVGATGPTGPTGPAGKDSTAAGGGYYARSKSSVGVNASEVMVVSLSLPAGRFMLSGTTGATSSSNVVGLCGLKGDSAIPHTTAYQSIGASDSEQLTTTGVAELSSPMTIRLMCSNVGGNYVVAESSLSAVPLAK